MSVWLHLGCLLLHSLGLLRAQPASDPRVSTAPVGQRAPDQVFLLVEHVPPQPVRHSLAHIFAVTMPTNSTPTSCSSPTIHARAHGSTRADCHAHLPIRSAICPDIGGSTVSNAPRPHGR